MFFQRSIAPHFLQLIKLAAFGSHDVHHDVDVINQHPLQVLLPLVTVGNFTHFLLDLFLYRVGNSPDLGLVVGFANDKKISNGFRNFPQVKGNDVLAFFILNGPDDGLVDFGCFG